MLSALRRGADGLTLNYPIQMKKTLIFFFVVNLIHMAGYSQSTTVPYGDHPITGKYAKINGIDMYYEVYGEGEPLLLIHGNGGSIKGHSKRIVYFMDKYQVIAVDSRAHGKTQDIGDSLTYEQMTSDINGLLDYLDVDSCFIWGQSDGGILGLKLAMDYPDKVKKLAVFGANTRPDTTAVFSSIAAWVDKTMATTTDEYKLRLFSLLKYQPRIAYNDLTKILAPVLIMTGDRDVIKLEHSLKIFYNIENSNLFVMPGATHFGSYEKPELFHQVLGDFFAKPFSKKSTEDIFK